MNATRIDKPTEAAKEIIESMNRYHHPPPDRRHIVAEFETISGVDDGEELFEALKRRGEIYRGTNGWVVT